MHHIAKKVTLLEGTAMEVLFQDGKVFHYDMAEWFDEYPQYRALEDRDLFLAGIISSMDIIWTDELDMGFETVYQEGSLIRIERMPIEDLLGNAIAELRTEQVITQTAFARITGIDQGDISRIEAGKANPSLKTLKRIAEGLGKELTISFEDR